VTTAPEDVRRPWLPAGLAAHGFTQADVGALTYLVVDEIVGSAVTLVLSAWPWADGLGRLRFLVDQDTRGVTVDADALRRSLYDGWLDRRPRIGDVFAAVVPQSVHDLQEPDGAPLWTRPIGDLVEGPVYDLTAEGRQVATLADRALVSPALSVGEAARLGLAGRSDGAPALARAVPRRDVVGSGDD
jgi:hypothetical protein